MVEKMGAPSVESTISAVDSVETPLRMTQYPTYELHRSNRSLFVCDKKILYATLHKPKPFLLRWDILPFLFIYLLVSYIALPAIIYEYNRPIDEPDAAIDVLTSSFNTKIQNNGTTTATAALPFNDLSPLKSLDEDDDIDAEADARHPDTSSITLTSTPSMIDAENNINDVSTSNQAVNQVNISPTVDESTVNATSTPSRTKRTLTADELASMPSQLSFGVMFSLPFIIASHLILLLACYWNVKVRAFAQYYQVPITQMNDATHIRVEPSAHFGIAAITPLLRNSGKTSEYWFDFQKNKYFYNMKDSSTTTMTPHIHDGRQGYFALPTLPTSLPLHEYTNSKGIQTLDDQISYSREYGDNYFDIPLPSFGELYYEHAMAPFFVFQVFCVLLWCLDEYWYYSMLTLFMLIMFEATLVKRRQKNLEDLRAMRQKVFIVYAYRNGKWEQASTQHIYPHDIISLTRSSNDTVCPADVLLLNGSAVVNEALLTGESVPQIKERLEPVKDESELLNMTKDHKRSIVFGGTKIMLSNSGDETSGATKDSEENGIVSSEVISTRAHHIPPPPDGGCVAYVLRTGFHTSQGELVRTILFSADRVSVNNREAIAFIGFLLIFAITAAGYVLQHGLADPERSRYKLLLNCIMIITSVVPPELPMELSLAVNTSLLYLTRCAIFCTEPFRIPLAGAVDVCAFDKTGTLTSDNFVVKGIAGVNAVATKKDTTPTSVTSSPSGSANEQSQVSQLSQSQQTPAITTSESDKQYGLTNPSDVANEIKYVIGGCHSLVTVDKKLVGDPLEVAAFNAINFTLENEVVSGTVDDTSNVKIRVLHRFPFNSTLKRMSAVTSVQRRRNSENEIYVTAKGAAEIMAPRFASLPDKYDEIHRYYSRQGCRVLALGYKQLTDVKDTTQGKAKIAAMHRDEAECDLVFAGFLVLEVPMKPDSAAAVQHLIESNHHVIMITGDNTLTACSVATQLNIADRPFLILSHKPSIDRPITLTENGSTEDSEASQVQSAPYTSNALYWTNVDNTVTLPYDPTLAQSSLGKLVEKYDLCVSGDALDYISQTLHATPQQLTRLFQHAVVYARTSPDQKELIIRCFKEAELTTLMCGDGTNDVGALKQAHVGVALIATPEQPPPTQQTPGKANSNALQTPNPAATSLTPAQPSIQPKSTSLSAIAKSAAPPKPLSEMSKDELKAYQKQQINELLSQMDDGTPSLVRLGDASIASPFTSKRPFVSSTLDIIRQGRCTLVTTLQMFHILGINCLMSAYSMSVLYIDGVKYGDYQMTISGMSIAMFFMFLSNSKPMERLSPERPRTKLFTWQMILSVAGQWLIHMIFLINAVKKAEVYIPRGHEHRVLEQEFKPNILNTVVFLLSNSTTVATFLCNYRGKPFMQPLSSNSNLKRALYITLGLMLLLASDIMPELNYWLELVPMPTDEFRNIIIWSIIGDLAGTYVFVQFMHYLSHERPKSVVLQHKFRTAEHQRKVLIENERIEKMMVVKRKQEWAEAWERAKRQAAQQMTERQRLIEEQRQRKIR